MILLPPSPKQARSIREATARINIWHGSVRSGKTIASLMRLAEAIRGEYRGAGAIVLSGRTHETIEANIIEPLQQMLGHQCVHHRRGNKHPVIFGKTVRMRSANDTHSEKNIRGDTIELWYGDEVSLWPKSFFDMGYSRLSPPGAKFFGTTNPDAPRHWLRMDYLLKPGMPLRQWHFTLRDNTSLNEEFLHSLEVNYTGLWKKRFIDGLWVMAEGVIWDAFDIDEHVKKSIPPGLTFSRWTVGVDYGTSNPFVALLCGLGSDGRVWIVDELRWDSRKEGSQKSDMQYSVMLKEFLKKHDVEPSRIWIDPSATSFIVQCRNDGMRNVFGAANPVANGLRAVGNLIANDRLRIVETPTTESGIIEEIPSYSWDPKAQEKGEDTPIKLLDHGPDALRYDTLSNSLTSGVLEYMKKPHEAPVSAALP